MRRTRYTAAIITFALAVIGPLSGTARAAFPGSDGSIAFSSNGPLDLVPPYDPYRGGLHIHTVEADGSGLAFLTPRRWITDAPLWSADGSMIAFVRVDRHRRVDALMTAGADGSNLSVVLPFSRRTIRSLAWSPDGTTLAFCAVRRHLAVFTVNVNGSSLTKITLGANDDCDPSWSPDGTSIAVDTVPWSATDNTDRITTMDPDGTGRVVVVPSGQQPDWSPDGARLVFSRYTGSTGNGTYDLFTVNADGTQLVRITDSLRNELDPAYSPSGTRIVYSMESHRASYHEIFDLWWRNADGTGGVHRLTDTLLRNETSPSWRPT